MTKYKDKKYCDYWGCQTEPTIQYGGDLFGFSIDFDLCREHYNYLEELKSKDLKRVNFFGGLRI